MSVQLSMCLEDGEKARQIYRDNFMWRIPYFSTYFDTVFPNTEPKPLTQTRYRELVEEAKRASNDESIGSFAFDPDMITQQFLRERAVPVGDPDDLIAAIKRYEEVGLDQLVLSPWTGPGVPPLPPPRSVPHHRPRRPPPLPLRKPHGDGGAPRHDDAIVPRSE